MIRKAVIALALTSVAWVGPALAEDWAIRGTVLTPGDPIVGGLVVIGGDRITAVGKDVPVPQGAAVVDDGDIVLPGFIDLHNHPTYNVFPEWRPPTPFANRYDWQATEDYDRLISIPENRLWESGRGCEANYFAEVMALAGGATAQAGSPITPTDPGRLCKAVLLRSLDNNSGLPHAEPSSPCPGMAPETFDVVINEVFPLQAAHEQLDWVRCALKQGALPGYLIHLAEGKPDDPDAQREFAMFQARGLDLPGVGIIQGTALSEDDLRTMKSNGVGLIWSPRSNEVLYGATLDIDAALSVGLAVAIGPDWNPTGSAGMLQEIAYAAARFRGPTARQFVEMGTAAPARIARLDEWIGSLEAGKMADLLLIRNRGGDPYANVVTATPADVRLVVVGGVPVYGDLDLMTRLSPGRTLDGLTVCGIRKALLRRPAAGMAFDAVSADLATQLRHFGTRLTGIACR